MQVELAVVQKSPAGSTGLYFQTQLYLCDPFHAFSLPDLNATHFKKSHLTATRGSVKSRSVILLRAGSLPAPMLGVGPGPCPPGPFQAIPCGSG